MHQQIKNRYINFIQKLNEEQLLNLLENRIFQDRIQNLSMEAIIIGYEEAKKRNLCLSNDIEQLIYNANHKIIWYYVSDNSSIGPISLMDLLFRYDSNHINPKTKVWKSSFSDWRDLDKTNLILDVSGYTQAPTPPPVKPVSNTLNQKETHQIVNPNSNPSTELSQDSYNKDAYQPYKHPSNTKNQGSNDLSYQSIPYLSPQTDNANQQSTSMSAAQPANTINSDANFKNTQPTHSTTSPSNLDENQPSTFHSSTQSLNTNIHDNNSRISQTIPNTAKSAVQVTNQSIAKKSVNNIFVWLLAFTPVINIVLNLVLSSMGVDTTLSFLYIIILILILVSFDLHLLSKAGYRCRWFLLWAMLIMPVYMFKRAKITGKYGYAVTNLVFFVILIILKLYTYFISYILF